MPDINRNVANPAGEDEILAGNQLQLRPGQDHFIAETDETGPVPSMRSPTSPPPPCGARRATASPPAVLVSAVLILIAVVMSLFPQLFTPSTRACVLELAGRPQPGHPFGFTARADIYSCTIHGRVPVAVHSHHGARGADRHLIGALAGFFGGILDSILSR